LQAYVSLKHEVDKLIVFERAGLLFIFNFHPTQSFTDYRVGIGKPRIIYVVIFLHILDIEDAGQYKIVLSSDDKKFGGWENIDTTLTYETNPLSWNGRKNYIQVRPRRANANRQEGTHILPSGLHTEQDCHGSGEMLSVGSLNDQTKRRQIGSSYVC
jgi:1,4-alpha-glucan branching enzyme